MTTASYWTNYMDSSHNKVITVIIVMITCHVFIDLFCSIGGFGTFQNVITLASKFIYST